MDRIFCGDDFLGDDFLGDLEPFTRFLGEPFIGEPARDDFGLVLPAVENPLD